MKRFLGIVGAVLVVLAVATVGVPAQSQVVRPDFSGTWTLVSGGRPAAPLFGGGVITQDQLSLTFSATVPTGANDPARVAYHLDGSATDQTITTVLGATWALTSQTKWLDKALVITTTYNTPIGHWQDVTTLSLDPAGTLRVITDKTPKQENVPRIVTSYTYQRK